MCLSILTLVLTLGLARTARDPDGDDWALEVDPRGRARVHSPAARTSTSSLHWSAPEGWEPKSRGAGVLTHTGGDQTEGVRVQDEVAADGAEAAASALACTVKVNSERKGARSFGVLACDDSGNPGASCMKSMLRDGTLTMGCDKFLCTEVGNPSSCCTLPGTARRIVCSSANFETEVSERDFEDCSRPCVERSITCTVNISGTVHTKEFLLVAKGINADANKVKMLGSIQLFDSTLHDLIDGNSSKLIAAAPSQRTKEALHFVLDIWRPFRQLLENSVDVVRAPNGQVDVAIIEEVAAGNVPLLRESDVAVGMLVDDAESSGAQTAGLVVDIAGRQRMLIQRMVKEVLLVVHNVSVTANVASLRGTSALFSDSHAGIILGATWVGVPRLRKMCTLQQMRTVSYKWQQFRPLVDQILGEDTASEIQSKASELTPTLVDLSVPLFTSMAEAVRLYVHDDDSCNPLDSITSSDWVYLINNVGKQRFLGQHITMLYMMVANGVDVQNSKVALTVKLVDTHVHLRSLVEGSIANHIPAPPTQEIADQLLSVDATWMELQAAVSHAINLDMTDVHTVHSIALLSQKHLSEMTAAASLYRNAVQASDPRVPANEIDISGRQRMLYQKMSKEAGLIHYGERAAQRWIELNSTRALYKTAHWTLLYGNASLNVSNTTNVCIVQQMKLALDRFVQLEEVALAVARGSTKNIAQMIELNELAFSAMNTAVGFYAEGEAYCAALQVSSEEWKGAIIQVGRLRALSQKASHAFVLAATRGGSADRMALNDAIAELHLTVQRLTYGYGSNQVPPPPTQDMLNYWFALADGKWRSFESKLKANDSVAATNGSLAFLAETEAAMSMYIEAASAANDTVPTTRMNIASRQVMLAHKMVKDMLLANLSVNASDGLSTTISEFERSHRDLLNGGSGLIAVIPERDDLLEQWDRVDRAWVGFRTLIKNAAGPHLQLQSSDGLDAINTTEVLEALNVLVTELDAAVPLYGKLDPYVPPEEPGLPWTILVRSLLACLLCSVVSVACHAAVREERRSRHRRALGEGRDAAAGVRKLADEAGV